MRLRDFLRHRHFGLVLALVLVVVTWPVVVAPPALGLYWPAMVALIIVFSTHRAALGLAAAGLSGCLLLAGGHPLGTVLSWATDHAWPSLTSSWHLGAIVFTLLLGGFAAILEKGGGLLPLLQRSGATDSAARPFLTGVFGLGILCFFDGLANSLMVGRVARPIADRLRVPRALLAYVVDTTSSAVACIAFISTWISVQLTLINDGIATLGIDEPAYLLFLRSIPYNFYCLFALILAFLTIRRDWRIGPMAKAPSHPPSGPAALRAAEAHRDATVRPWRALIPIAVLLLAIPVCYYLLHTGPEVAPRLPITLPKIQDALGSNAGPLAFTIGSGIALLAAALCAPGSQRRELPRTIGRGAGQLAPALGVLVLAWILGSVLKSLGTAEHLAGALGNSLPIATLPAAVFVLGCVMSFVSGTSWGTMALLMPLALPALGPMAAAQSASPELVAQLAPAVVAAVFGGAVFGDHCSPFSDTTIVSSLACGITTPEHTITQLPYALMAAGTALGIGYLLTAFVLSPWIALAAGTAVLTAMTSIRPRRQAA
jgi:Na+/H+ antiporter NhaC